MTDNINTATDPVPEKEFVEYDRHFIGWLTEVGGSFAISSYKKNLVIFIGTTMNISKNIRVPSIWMSSYVRPMGLCVSGNMFYVGSANMLWTHCENGARKSHNEAFGPFDASYVPRTLNLISDIDCHDIVRDKNGQVYFISALFGCVCVPSPTHSFKVFWSPPWQTKIAAEDRCHLNGLCCDESGSPRFVTAISRTDTRGGWREHRTNGGIIYDIIDNKLVCEGLCMPHSPRWFRNRLWVLESGTGHLGYVDDSGAFKPMTFIPGYLRGMSFIGDKYALIGSSLDRHEKVFQDIPLGENLKKRGVSAKCGVFVVDMDSMDVIHEIVFPGGDESSITEIYDVCTFPGKQRTMSENINDDKLLRDYKIDQ
jgi:uncharacterized protein (TIGR03032 family)